MRYQRKISDTYQVKSPLPLFSKEGNVLYWGPPLPCPRMWVKEETKEDLKNYINYVVTSLLWQTWKGKMIRWHHRNDWVILRKFTLRTLYLRLMKWRNKNPRISKHKRKYPFFLTKKHRRDQKICRKLSVLPHAIRMPGIIWSFCFECNQAMTSRHLIRQMRAQRFYWTPTRSHPPIMNHYRTETSSPDTRSNK